MGSCCFCMDTVSVLQDEKSSGPSLVVQWVRICLPMQRTQVQSLGRFHMLRATKPVCRNELVHALHATAEAHSPRARAPQQRVVPLAATTRCNQRKPKQSARLSTANKIRTLKVGCTTM